MIALCPATRGPHKHRRLHPARIARGIARRIERAHSRRELVKCRLCQRLDSWDGEFVAVGACEPGCEHECHQTAR